MKTKNVMLDGSKVTISQHAIDRYTERFGGDEKTMRDQLSRALLYGAQRGTDRIFVDEGAAFVLDRYRVIKTTLTTPMLIANMELAFRGLKNCEPANVAPYRSESDLQFIATLKALATHHCQRSYPYCFRRDHRRSHNRDIRKLGIAPQSEHEKMYLEMFLAAYKEKIAEQSLNEHAANKPASNNRYI